AECISQMFPDLGTQEVNSKQQQHTQEVGIEPARKELLEAPGFIHVFFRPAELIE
ncbi:hypothetical protein KUCAC02_018161, partial [Chaenocephalus aceratus]